MNNENHTQTPIPQNAAKATFAGGCFWCMEKPFEQLDGVYEVVSGFTGGSETNPSYEQVASGSTNHVEAVQIYFDPQQITYASLLETFWRQIDPTDDGGQFVDRGEHYTTAIFYHNDEQQQLAEESKQQLSDAGIFDKPIVTRILPATEFYQAEDYHQDYYEHHPLRYNFYRANSGRDQFLDQHWEDDDNVFQQIDQPSSQTNSAKATTLPNYTSSSYTKPSDETLQEALTPLQYKVTQHEGTEPPFNNSYWNNTEPGIYVDIVSGEPLFSSLDKFKSGTGWPSFIRPLEQANITKREDRKLFTTRTEVRSKAGDSHLGHVFEDGPEPTGLRYCINSAALRFIPADQLEEQGYGEYASLFDQPLPKTAD